MTQAADKRTRNRGCTSQRSVFTFEAGKVQAPRLLEGMREHRTG